MATYLSLINKVLVRLRETAALTPTDNEYVTLIGYLVNDAKKVVEVAWDWSALRTTSTVSATTGVNSYVLTGSGVDFKVLDAYNQTSKQRLKLITKNEMNNKTELNTAASQAPEWFCYNGVDSNGDTRILVYPTPDASYTLKFDLVVREPELTLAASTTALPEHPIVLYAWAMAARERGETGGTAAQELFSLADRALGDAVSLDAHRYGAELTWRAP